MIPRVFVAACLDEESLRSLDPLLSFLGGFPALRAVKRQLAHVTLRFFGDLEESGLERFQGAMASGVRPGLPVEVRAGTLEGLASRSRLKVVYLSLGSGVGGLEAWRESVEAAGESAGLGRDPRDFVPHLTLARYRGRPPRSEVEAALLPGELHFSRVEAFSSTLRPQGPLHRGLFHWGEGS